MRPIALCCMLNILALTGCSWLEHRPPANTVPPALKAAAPMPVQPQEITAANAKIKLQQLQEELDREAEILDKSPPLP